MKLRSLSRAVASLVLLLGWSTVVSARPDTPDAPALVKQVIEAHRALGPTTITGHLTVRTPDHLIAEFSSTFQWNDSTHYRADVTSATKAIVAVVNGVSCVVCTTSGGRMVLDRSGKHMGAVAPPFLPVVSEIADLAKGDSLSVLRKAVVTQTELAGDPVYRIYIPIPTEGKGAYRALLVGRNDHLTRKLVVHPSSDSEVSGIMTYRHMDKPFDATTFAFQAPPGAEDVTGKG